MYSAIVEPKLYFLAPQLQCTTTFGCALQLEGKKEKKNYFAFILFLSLSSLPLCVSPNVHHAFTLLLVVVVFWWLAPLDMKIYPAIMEPKRYFLAPQLQCTATFGCALQLKGKKEKKNYFAFILLLSLSSVPLYVSPMSTMRSHYFWLWLCFSG